MAIWLHSYISRGKRFIQVESQPSHIIGIFRTLTHSTNYIHDGILKNAESTYFEYEKDGTITFYQGKNTDKTDDGIWTYLVYECPVGEEKVFLDSSIDTSTILLINLFAGQKLVQEAVDINEYLKYKYVEDEYLDVQLPLDWNTYEGRAIANLLVEEQKALKSLSLFAESAGREYMQAVLNGFIKAAQEVLENGGTLQDFELAQHNVLKRIRIDDMANLILEYNDYRIWQVALPSKSKAVEYAFNQALTLICRIN